MAAFKALRDKCNDFDTYLKGVMPGLSCARVNDNFEDDVDRKMRDFSLFTAKLRLLQATNTALTPEVRKQNKDQEEILSSYRESAILKVKEQQAAATLTRTHAVQKLITTPDKYLEPEQLERKVKIIDQLYEFRNKESELRLVDNLLAEKESERDTLREKWCAALGKLREPSASDDLSDISEDDETRTGSLYDILCKLVDKMDTMRLLISHLVTSRCSDYDWVRDPHRRLAALKIARESNSVDHYLED